jgi:hypothetical protein
MTTSEPRSLNVITKNGIPFRVLDLQPGQVGAYPAAKGPERIVEFYDARFPHTTYGQFVSRYYANTLLTGRLHGLCLDGLVRNWSIDADTWSTIENWLKEGN